MKKGKYCSNDHKQMSAFLLFFFFLNTLYLLTDATINFVSLNTSYFFKQIYFSFNIQTFLVSA